MQAPIFGSLLMKIDVMTITLKKQNKFVTLRMPAEAFFVDSAAKIATNKAGFFAVAEGRKHLSGAVVKACMALALQLSLTACVARAPVVSEKAQRAEALFKLHCSTAGETIKRTVMDVEGIFVLKGRADKINFSDQFLMDDPYGRDLGGSAYIESFLKADHELVRRYAALLKNPPKPDPNEPVGYDYVDMTDPLGGVRARYTAYVNQPGKTDPRYSLNAFRVVLQKSPASGAAPRYGVTYEDISTHEDRMVWIAGSSLKVIDLQTNEVIAERIGYMIDRGQGITAGGRSPWLLAASNACPAFPGQHAYQLNQTARFVEKILVPVRPKKAQD